jgi:hypothetical protein
MKLWRYSMMRLLPVLVIGIAGAARGQSTVPDAVLDATHTSRESTGVSSAAQSVSIVFVSADPKVKLGPVFPEQISLAGSVIPSNALTEWGAAHRLRFFGWADGGYTWSSSGSGLLAVEPRENRFGDAWLLNQTGLVLERTRGDSGWSWGFRGEFYMGADAALLHPVNGFGPSPTDNPRFSTDFRQAYFSFHAPLLTDEGVDVKLGRQYVPIGYDTTMAPYRPLYSEPYAWLYSENGATTGAIATVHVNPALDIVAGATEGVSAMFDFQGRAPDYIARGIYWLGPSKRTKLVGTFYTGPKPIAAAKGRAGKWQSIAEAQLVHNVNRRLTLASETNIGWETRDPGHQFNTSQWYGTYGVGIVHLTPHFDFNTRGEWFGDADGSRIGKRGDYGEITAGPNFMPSRMINFRPEVRWDTASNPVFGSVGSSNLKSHQWTYAFETLIKF